MSPERERAPSPRTRPRKRSEHPDADESSLEVQDDKRRRVAGRAIKQVSQEAENSATRGQSRKRRASDEEEEEAPPRKEAKRDVSATEESDQEMEDATNESQSKSRRNRPSVPGEFDTMDDDEIVDEDDIEMTDRTRSGPPQTQAKRERSGSDEDQPEAPPRHRARVDQGTSTADLRKDAPMLDVVRRRTRRRPEEVWENAQGQRCRISSDGREEKLVQVRERRRKYNMVRFCLWFDTDSCSSSRDSLTIRSTQIEMWSK
jgi:hypothetical protein